MAKRDELYLRDIIKVETNKKESKIIIQNIHGEQVEVDTTDVSSNSAFIEYRSRTEIADNISSALANKYKKGKFKFEDDSDIKNKVESSGGLFPLSDLNKTTGLLSVCPAVTALMNACYSMKSKNGKFESNHKNDDKINYCINYILYKINPNYVPLDETLDGETSNFSDYVFDASPYLTDSDYNFTHSKSYLDTVTWVILALQTARSFALIKEKDQRLNLKEFTPREIVESKAMDKIENTDEEQEIMIKKLEDGIVACVQLTTEMAIEQEVNGVIKTQGWSYTGLEYDGMEDETRFNAKKALVEPSLYFSYVATTVYLGLYKDFEKYIILFREIENALKEGKLDFIPETMREQYWNYWTNIIDLKRVYEKENEGILTEEEKTLFQKMDSVLVEDLHEVKFLMNRINLGYQITNTERKGYLTKIKAQSLDVADIVWNKFKDKIADHFVYPNANIVDEKSIENSGSSNELFNGLFVIGIILNSAYDAQLPEDEYENLIDVLQACVQKTQRYYDALERKGESYKVNNYVLQFIEKDPVNEKLGTILRKSSIKVSSLVPILLKMNNLVSEFVIQYPQRQMRNHLISIMKNRMESNDKSVEDARIWLWEGDEYQSISNYYYIDALNAFYNYYDKYEKRYIKFDKAITLALKDSVILNQAVQEDINNARVQAYEEMEATKKVLNDEHAATVSEKENIIKIHETTIQQLAEEKAIIQKEAEAGQIGREILNQIDLHLLNDTSEILMDKIFTLLEEKIAMGDSEIRRKFLNIIASSILKQALEQDENVINSGHTKTVTDSIPYMGSEQAKEAIVKNFSEGLVKHIADSAIAETVDTIIKKN